MPVDNSTVGLKKARELADWAQEPGTLDGVVPIYTHLPSAIRSPVHRRLAEGLQTGGGLILEAFHSAQLAHSTVMVTGRRAPPVATHGGSTHSCRLPHN